MTRQWLRGTGRAVLVVGVLLAISTGVAAATPIGQITQFAAPGFEHRPGEGRA